jgi:PhzF family phenazine biosynthesis protein
MVRAPHAAPRREDLTVASRLIVHRLAAFTDDPAGGNPAGVVLSQQPLEASDMQRIAGEVGFSETAFLAAPSRDQREWQVRYFAPAAEVPFCGHATIAAGVLLGQQVGSGRFRLRTPVGQVPLTVAAIDGRLEATLTSVAPSVEQPSPSLVQDVLTACGYAVDQLDHRFPPAVAFAGARHLVLVLRRREHLAALAYDVERLRALMGGAELTTVAFLWLASDGTWHARNPFPVGGVVEDPATGAAAAALGGYLRGLGAVAPPVTFLVHQGEDMGRPSVIRVHVPPGPDGIEISGTAVAIHP